MDQEKLPPNSPLNYDGDEEEKGLISNQRSPQRLSGLIYKIGTRLDLLVPASLFTILFLVFFFAAQTLSGDRRDIRNYETGFESDLVAARTSVELVQYAFEGQIRLHGDGSFYRNETNSRYVGEPSPAIDRAWIAMLSGLNIDLSPEEVPTQHAKETFQWNEDQKYFSGLEVFHSLHCLNRIRQAFDLEYYREVFPQGDHHPSVKMHIDHCIDHLRQAIQCHSDLTPMNWERQGNKLILKPDTKHTCRNFDKIHKWTLEREIDYESKTALVDGQLIIVD